MSAFFNMAMAFDFVKGQDKDEALSDLRFLCSIRVIPTPRGLWIAPPSSREET